MDVITDRPQIPRPAPVHDQALVAPTEHRPDQTVAPVKTAAILTQQPLHPLDQVRFRRLHHGVRMVTILRTDPFCRPLLGPKLIVKMAS